MQKAQKVLQIDLRKENGGWRMADGGWRKALILKSFLGGLRTGLSKKPQKSAKIFPFVNKGQEKGRKDFLDLFAESKRRKFMVNKQFLSFK